MLAVTDDEYETIRVHPERGEQLLRELGGFSDTVHELVRSHNERLDGSGYPKGLAGEQLSLHVRVLAVCDVYDALRTSRVYRGAWTDEEALAYLNRHTGSLFDGRTVAALEQVVGEPARRPARAARQGRELPAQA